MCVNNLSKVALDSAAAGIEPANLQSQIQRPNHCATEVYRYPHPLFAPRSAAPDLCGFMTAAAKIRRMSRRP